jgi:hypothetical protein
VSGFFQISFKGGRETNSRDILANFMDENTIVLSTVKQYKHFMEAKELIEQYQIQLNDGALSTADEVKKYYELYQSGALTEEEFMKEKKRLLDK